MDTEVDCDSPSDSRDATLPSVIPQHVAIIMDGNGRWANRSGLRRMQGHRKGAATVKGIVKTARRLGVRYLTLYAFSTENWARPEEEVSALMLLFQEFLRQEIENLKDNGIRLRVIGERDRLPSWLGELVTRCQNESSDQTGMDLILAVSYGGRREILEATKSIVQAVQSGVLSEDALSEDLFRSFLYTKEIPDPDLLIRTSGESRISNFLLWQLAYSEIVVSPVLWPDFSPEEFLRCIEEFSKRERRFGRADSDGSRGQSEEERGFEEEASKESTKERGVA